MRGFAGGGSIGACVNSGGKQRKKRLASCCCKAFYFCFQECAIEPGILVRSSDTQALAFFDTTFGADSTTKVEQPGTAYFTTLQQFNFCDGRRRERENTLYANAAGNFTNRESFRGASAFDLDDITFENLDTFLVSFNDTVADGNSVAGAKFRKVNLLRYLFVNVFYGVHFISIYGC